ncbi:hypothetical protein [Veronia pacifica]|uniref:hypothetical protein n=1 Tax=Veronia pacifica TaxID=1080227 RepID=UPI0015864BA3
MAGRSTAVMVGSSRAGRPSLPLRRFWRGYLLRTLRRDCAQIPTHLRRKGEADDSIA